MGEREGGSVLIGSIITTPSLSPSPSPSQCDSKEAVEKVLHGEKPSETLGKDKKKR